MESKRSRGKRKKLAIDFASLKKGRGEELGVRKTAGEGGYSAFRSERPVETYKANRRCKCCNCFLARTNPDNICHPCDRAIQEWKNFPWRRAELEQVMEAHCLKFVHEHFVKKGKARSVTGGGEKSSGSWARAAGRKTIEKKE